MSVWQLLIRPKKALLNTTSVVILWPTTGQKTFKSGNTYFKYGDLDRAIANFREVLRISDDPDVQQYATEQLSRLGATP